MAFIDFTNPAACKWYQSKLEGLIALGVDSFKVRFFTLTLQFNTANPNRRTLVNASQRVMLYTLMDLTPRKCTISIPTYTTR